MTIHELHIIIITLFIVSNSYKCASVNSVMRLTNAIERSIMLWVVYQCVWHALVVVFCQSVVRLNYTLYEVHLCVCVCEWGAQYYHGPHPHTTVIC